MKGSARLGGPRVGWRWLVPVAVAVLVASCGGSPNAQAPQATVPSAATSVSTDPYAVPAKITPAYVQRVLDQLEHVAGTATDEIVSHKTLDSTAALDLRAIYADAEFNSQTTSWVDQINAGLRNYLPNPGAIRDTVVGLISASSSCVFVSARRDFSDVAVSVPPQHLSYIALSRLHPVNDPKHINPTGWVIYEAGYNSSGLQPDDPCKSLGG